MKTLLSYACTAVFAFCALPHCFAASPWDGTWKENEAKSKLTGDTMTYTMKGAGFHYSNGATVEYDFSCDGKPYPTIADRTITCTGSAAAGYDVTVMAGNKVLSKSHRSFSPNGASMMIHGSSMRPDGTSYEYDETYKRIGAGKDLAGKWLDVKDKSGSEMVRSMMIKGDMLHIDEPAYKEAIDAKLDGSDGTVTGPNIPAGAAMAYKAESPTKLHFVTKLNGKVLDEGTYNLSPDGKSYIEEEWVPGKMSEKATMVFEKTIGTFGMGIFYFAMSLLMLALVTYGFSRTVGLLGWVGAADALLVLVMGLWATFAEPAPFALERLGLVSMAGFGIPVALAILWRKRPAYHRRLVFLGTAMLTNAAFARFPGTYQPGVI